MPIWQYVEKKWEKKLLETSFSLWLRHLAVKTDFLDVDDWNNWTIAEKEDVENSVSEPKTLAESIPAVVQQAAKVDETLIINV